MIVVIVTPLRWSFSYEETWPPRGQGLARRPYLSPSTFFLLGGWWDGGGWNDDLYGGG